MCSKDTTLRVKGFITAPKLGKSGCLPETDTCRSPNPLPCPFPVKPRPADCRACWRQAQRLPAIAASRRARPAGGDRGGGGGAVGCAGGGAARAGSRHHPPTAAVPPPSPRSAVAALRRRRAPPSPRSAFAALCRRSSPPSQLYAVAALRHPMIVFTLAQECLVAWALLHQPLSHSDATQLRGFCSPNQSIAPTAESW